MIWKRQLKDPFPKLRNQLLVNGIDAKDIEAINKRAINLVAEDYQKALAAEDPRPEDLFTHDFAPTPVIEEKGVREPAGKEKR